MTETSAFDWVRRMGVHEAYHLDATNRLIHWLCIPLELAALLKILGAVQAPLDLGLVAIGLVSAIYVVADVGGGVAMAALLLVLRAAVGVCTTGSVVVDVIVSAAVFAGAFVFQTRVGHGRFEHGIDDTAMNLAEVRRTWNPIPLVLVFYYHALELLFALGYRRTLAGAMHEQRARELARIPNDPRR